MAKTLRKLSKKRRMNSLGVKSVGRSAATGRTFSFPANETVKLVGRYLLKAPKGGSTATARSVKNAYKSAGHSIFGITDDGVVIVKPAGKPDNFKLGNLKKVLSEVRASKG